MDKQAMGGVLAGLLKGGMANGDDLVRSASIASYCSVCFYGAAVIPEQKKITRPLGIGCGFFPRVL